MFLIVGLIHFALRTSTQFVRFAGLPTFTKFQPLGRVRFAAREPCLVLRVQR